MKERGALLAPAYERRSEKVKAGKGKWAAMLAAALLCESMFSPGMAGMGAGLLQVRAETANVALNREVEASSLESAGGAWTADKVTDGDVSSADSRWSSAMMRPSGSTAETVQTPQWLIIDLKAEQTQVESIKMYFHLKVWSTQYKIQTCDTKDGAWEDVYSVTRDDADTQNVTDEITAAQMTKSVLKRYVRFYFEKLNLRAGGTGVSVKEIEIRGTQTGEVTGVSSAAEALNQITELTVAAEDQTLQIPQVSDDYEITVHGSEVDKVLGDDGRIAAHHIGERSFNVILKAVSKTDASDTAKKNFTVTVPDKTGLYPELYKKAANPNPMPDVLPTIQEWYGYEGDFTLTQDSEIVVNDAAAVGLDSVALEMQEDLEDICGFTLNIRKGNSSDANDIYLESQTEDTYGTGEEGYFLVNGENGIRIYSSAKTGVLYGTVTVEQILYQDEEHVNVPKGVIRDYPLYGVRGIMFDVARIPTRIQFLNDYTKILKWYKLNEMQIHLNDNQWSEPAYSPDPDVWTEVEASHRLESDLFPSLATMDSKFWKEGDNEGRYDYYYSTHTGKNGELYYTKEEYAALQEQAGDRGVELIAELDTPGHSAAYNKYVYAHQEEVIKSLAEHGYLNRDEYLDADGELKDGVTFYIHNPKNFELLAIDDESADATMKQNAVNAKIFMTALFDEYLGGENPLFTTGTVSAGVDEYWDKSGNNKEAFRRYMNYMYDLLGDTEDGYGKEVRMWGAMTALQGSTQVNNNIVLDIWATYEDDPIARMQEGFRVINIPQPYLYTTPGRYHKDMVREQYIYYNWDPVIFNGSIRAEKGEPQLLGAKAALWGDENREGITEADLNERYLRVAAMLSEKTWGGTKEDDTFLDYEQTFDALREGPGTQIANQIDSKTNVVLDYDFENVSKDGKTVYDASGNGYNGKLTGGSVVQRNGETMLKFDGSTILETPLQSLGYPYTMSFDVYLDGTENNTKESSLFGGYDGRLQIAGINGELSLNRDYFSQSFGYTVENAVKHRITIVGTYQATKLYVDGVFRKILYAAASDPDNGGSIGVDTKITTDADNNFRTTFVFPLNVIGKDFSGCLGNIRAYNKALSTEELKAEGFTGVGEADVARNRGAYADNGNSTFWDDTMRLYPAWKATDGDGHVTGASGVSTSHESRWNSSDRNTDFLMIDLGQTRKISKVVIDWEASRYGAAYDIQVSEDGEKWNTVKSVTGNSSALTTDTFEETAARYVRMQGVQRKSGSNEYCIYEMKVYGKVDKTALTAECAAAEAILERADIGWETTGAGSSLHESFVLAKAVCSDVMAGQEETDAALAELKQAVENWGRQSAGAALQQKVEQAAAMLSQKEQYEAAGWSRFEAAYNAALNAGNDISAAEYEALLKNLEAAWNSLVKKAQGSNEAVPLAAPAVTAVKSQKTGVQISWNASANASAYQLYRKTGNTVIKVGSAVTGTTAFDENPAGGKNMFYYVVALAGNQSAWKDSATGQAKAIKLPKMTAKVTAVQVKGKKKVTVKWKKVKKASSYLIYRSEGKKGKWKKIAAVKKKKGTVYRDSKKLKKGKTYFYKVVAVSGGKYSPMKAAKKSVKIK